MIHFVLASGARLLDGVHCKMNCYGQQEISGIFWRKFTCISNVFWGAGSMCSGVVIRDSQQIDVQVLAGFFTALES